jgi:hypothetical protein
MSTGGKVCAETAADREKLSRPAKKRINYTATPGETISQLPFEQASFPFCQAVRNDG